MCSHTLAGAAAASSMIGSVVEDVETVVGASSDFEPWLSDCRTLSDTSVGLSDTVGRLSEATVGHTVGRLSDGCRTAVGLSA